MSVLLKGPHTQTFSLVNNKLLCCVFMPPSCVYLCFPVLGRVSAAACLGVNTGGKTAAKSSLYTHQHSCLDLISRPGLWPCLVWIKLIIFTGKKEILHHIQYHATHWESHIDLKPKNRISLVSLTGIPRQAGVVSSGDVRWGNIWKRDLSLLLTFFW